MRPSRRRPGLTALVVILLAGCGAPQPSTPSGSPSTIHRPRPRSPRRRRCPRPPHRPRRHTSRSIGSVAVTVSDRLRVRSQPRVSDNSAKYDRSCRSGRRCSCSTDPSVRPATRGTRSRPSRSVGSKARATAGSRSPTRTASPGWDRPTAPTPGSAWPSPMSPARPPTPRTHSAPPHRSTPSGSTSSAGLSRTRRSTLGHRNMVFSPTSIVLALAMARAGAKGETAAQMDKVIHAAGWDSLAGGVNALDQALASRNATWNDGDGPKELTLRLANAPFGQHGWTIDPAYLDASRRRSGPACARSTMRRTRTPRARRSMPGSRTGPPGASRSSCRLTTSVGHSADARQRHLSEGAMGHLVR